MLAAGQPRLLCWCRDYVQQLQYTQTEAAVKYWLPERGIRGCCLRYQMIHARFCLFVDVPARLAVRRLFHSCLIAYSQ